jgi:hypothetical protein
MFNATITKYSFDAAFPLRNYGSTLAAFLALAWLAPTANSAAVAAARSTVSLWTVVIQPARLVNGSPVLFRVTPPRPVRALSGKWLGHEIEFNFDPTHKSWFALAGVSLETKPGTYSLQLHAETSSGQSAPETLSFEKQIRVERQRYPRAVLKVPPRYTAPSPEEQREIEQDKTTKAEAFKTLSPERE